MRRVVEKIVIAAGLAMGAQYASAMFVTSASTAFGAGSLVTDTASGLTWLNLNVTRGVSYNDVATDIATDSDYAGFRIASQTDLQGLMSDAGFSIQIPSGNLSDPGRLAANQSFAAAFSGTTVGGQALYIGNSLLPNADPSSFLYFVNQSVVGVGVTGSGVVPTAFFDGTGPARTVADAGMSTWVVYATPVPEPASYALMIAGLGAVMFGVRRQRSVRVAA